MLHGDTPIMVLGVVLSVSVVALLVWYVNSIIPRELGQREWLTRFVALVLTVFLGIFASDVMVSWDVQLMSDDLRRGLFDLIKSIVLVVFGYQFGARTSGPDDDKPSE
jgi:multisubunit Na+/H+ antiporter MnhE subunit